MEGFGVWGCLKGLKGFRFLVSGFKGFRVTKSLRGGTACPDLLGTKQQVQGSKFKVSGSWFKVPCFLHIRHEGSKGFKVSCSKSKISETLGGSTKVH